MDREQQVRGRGRFQGQRRSQRSRGSTRRYSNSNSRSSIHMVKQQDLKFPPHVESKAQSATINNVAQSIKETMIFDLSTGVRGN